jgi:hypothetical protein
MQEKNYRRLCWTGFHLEMQVKVEEDEEVEEKK